MAADKHALFAAVVAAPEDDLPRRVYADWLEENGRTGIAALLRSRGYLSGGDPYGDSRQLDAHPGLGERKIYVPRGSPEIVSSVRCGILFFMAWWSGPAGRAFSELV